MPIGSLERGCVAQLVGLCAACMFLSNSSASTQTLTLGSRLKVMIESERCVQAIGGFQGEAVRHYVDLLLDPAKTPSTLVAAPPEFEAVVACSAVVVPRLLDLLTDDKGWLRVAALQALLEITNKSFGALEAFAGDTQPDRAARERALIEWREWWKANRHRGRVQWLVDDLVSRDSGRKRRAAIELGTSGDSTAIAPLRLALKDPALRFYAALSLAQLSDLYGAPELFEGYLKNDNEGYRRIGIEALKRLVGDDHGFIPTSSAKSRQAAISRWEAWWNKTRATYGR